MARHICRTLLSVGLGVMLAPVLCSAYAQSSSAPAAAPAPPPVQSRDLKALHPDNTTSPATLAIPRSYALVIGISHYKNLPAAAQLEFPDRDAASMYTTLISPDGGQFPAENVHKLIGADATEANIRHELEGWLPSVTKPQDRVLIYFAGHGLMLEGQAYLAPYDVDLHNVAGTSYPMATLGRDIGTLIQGKWKVLITDACHSGAITPEDDRASLNKSLLDLHNSLFSLTASRDRERSFESPEWGGGHGIFTYYVLQGLNGAADTNGDGVVSADELAEYVHSNVREATKGQQNPTSERGSFDPDMVLAYNPSHRAGVALPAPVFGGLVFDANLDNTEVYVDGKSAGTASKGKGLRLPGIAPGAHTVEGFHMGYEPDGPREEQVYPGQDTTVSLHILIARPRNKAALDLMDKGIQSYRKGYKENYEKAAAYFRQSIALDPQYSPAYVYLGRVENALYEDTQALEAFRKAIQIDPDSMEARASYAGALLDQGDLDETVRQADVVTNRDPANGMAWYLLSQAYARKGSYPQCLDAATQAVHVTPANGEAHLWLAECEEKLNKTADAENDFNRYIELTNFDSGTSGKVNYYLAGYLFGAGTKRRAAEADIWKQQRNQAYAGLCECKARDKVYSAAIPLCQKALTFVPDDPRANFRLGTIYLAQWEQSHEPSLLSAARPRLELVIAFNPDTEGAALAKSFISRIDGVLASNK